MKDNSGHENIKLKYGKTYFNFKITYTIFHNWIK